MSNQMMNALAVTVLGKKAELISLPIPVADANSIVIKTAYSSVSIGTEMWIAEGKRNDYGEVPFVNGYQATGKVVAIGPGAENKVKLGDLVAVFCSGAHSEYVKASIDLVHKLSNPDSMQACSMFVQPSVAANAWNLANLQTGNIAYVVGQGLVGQCASMIAKLRGAYVIASDISEERLIRSRANCADWVINSTEENALDAILQQFPEGVDVVAESTGFTALLDDAMSACRRKGTFVFLGWYPDRASFHFQTPHEKQLNAVFPCFIGDRPVRESVIRWIEEGKLNMKALISHEIHWSEADYVYNQLFTSARNSYNGITIKWE
ncbi:zinc-dependent alcohol dehydrogenase [Paenibacillus albus]|uniref:Zinc-binding alcohol dehydrogenase n=1 Tax=Paenibacillus albus TaxID=2495582 RepID=A0A3Q8X6J1_9BACL|nr:zinc-binding alcohol dehydrogenase [Paenibacillus albus]AZN41615.1 zinc-binding alcohol dehydrogenase [Paenibacillus albus]